MFVCVCLCVCVCVVRPSCFVISGLFLLLQFIVLFIHDAIASNKTFEDVYPTAVKVCVPLLDSRNISGEYMCPGIISSYGPVVSLCMYIIIKPE